MSIWLLVKAPSSVATLFMIMKALIVVLLLTVCFLESTSAKFVYLNSTTITSCTAQEQCWFFEPSLWTDEAVPAENDEVLIEGFAASYYMFLNTSITLTGLTILADFHLQVSSYANVSISNITLFGAKISLQDQAQVSLFRSSLFTFVYSCSQSRCMDWKAPSFLKAQR